MISPLLKRILFVVATTLSLCSAHPISSSDQACLANPKCGPIPGQSSLYSSYKGIAAPFPGNTTGAILNTTSGPPAPDDRLWQNLLSAEWVVFSFYQQGVEFLNQSAVKKAGFPADTIDRIKAIRDNEAGHLRIFQNLISSNSIKPGPCKYKFPFDDVESYLVLQNIIEVSSMAFLTGFARQANLKSSSAALVAIAETESRHNTWSLIDIWNSDPFAGPADTVFPYANQILLTTRQFIVSGSCPEENPVYPSPVPRAAPMEAIGKSLTPGSRITYNFTDPNRQPQFSPKKDYFAVFFHGPYNISVPFDVHTKSATIPSEFDPLGIIVSVIADSRGAPESNTVLAGPSIVLEQPEQILKVEEEGLL